MLAIAAPSFNQPSETFIRAHVRHIAPGETILICENERGAETLGCPVLSRLDPEPAPRNLGERAMRAVRTRLRGRLGPTLTGRAEQRVRAFLETYRPTALLAEYGPVGCLLRRACNRAGVPLYVHFHGFDATQLGRQGIWRHNYGRLFAEAAGVIAPSQFLATHLGALGCPAPRISVSPCGIDPSDFPVTAREPGRLLAVGRLVEKKAPHLTIRAFAAVAARHREARLEIVGDGPLRGRCEAEIARLGLGDRVTLHGALAHQEVRARFARAAVFVQHSVVASNGDSEGFPVAILEAMGSALPVVGTRHSGIPEGVLEGETGLLVEEHDVEGMAEAMLALLSDPERAARMGAAGRRRVEERFTHAHTAARLREIMRLDG